jgi:hypothetical protein
MSQTQDVIDALDNAYPPTNPAVLLAAARDAYLSGIRHREIVRLLSWTLYVIANNVPGEVTPGQREAIIALQYEMGMKDEPDEPDDDEWTNREGMPEFSGSFR